MYFDIKKSSNGQYWWVVKGENHETVCPSELYTSKAAAKHGIRVVKDGAASATVYDETGEVSGDVNARVTSV